MSEPRILQRVVFPSGDNLDVVPLYVETDVDRGGADLVSSDEALPSAHHDRQAPAAVGVGQRSVRFGNALGAEYDAVGRRRSAIVRAGRRASFATYLNAFPASYWRRWSVLDAVQLRVRVAGIGTVIVYRSSAKGHSYPVETIPFDCDEPQDVVLNLPLGCFIDGGWYWFDVAAGRDDATIEAAEWVAVDAPDTHGRFSIGITTYNRPAFCLEQLRALGAAREVGELLDTVYVIDQGTERVADDPDFGEATKLVADRLQLITQTNLGGSGGFSRAMAETISAGCSDYVLLLDDDIVLEPEGILRALTFADLSRKPLLVGGHMFSLYNRSVLHAFGETVAPYPWWWGPAPHTVGGHDFGRRNLRNTPWLHRRVDVDYNGWWMCLIPTAVVAQLGLAMPFFIKWDDAEYGLRAARAGIPTVSMPGVAAWHIPWDDKTDALDWQAYYHLRNRLVTALLHSPFERGGQLVGVSLETQLQHLLSMQYSTAELRLMAIEDILAGPEHLHRTLAGRARVLRTAQAKRTDGSYATDLAAYPAPRRRRPPKRHGAPAAPRNPVDLVAKASVALARQLAPVSPSAAQRPEAVVPHQDAQWTQLSRLDSAVVSAADGTGAAWYRRDPATVRRLLGRTVALHTQLLAQWPQLRRAYRIAAPGLVTPTAWARNFRPDEPEQ